MKPIAATGIALLTALGAAGATAALERREAPAATAAHPFTFSRAVYSSGGGWGRGNAWATDWPKSDLQFLAVLTRLTNIDAYPSDHPIRLDDAALRSHPFVYLVEPGYMNLSTAEVEGLRGYLEAGGFLVVDDFWGSREWANFEQQMRRVLPAREIVELPLTHPLFRAFYTIDEIVQVPAIGNIRRGRTHEQDGFVPHVRGIFDDDGRLMVVINWNTDLGDAWEWAEQPDYPLMYSTYAFRMGVNMVVYAMTH